MVESDYQTVINGGLGIWLAVLSFFGVKHYRRDVRSYYDILNIIASLQETLAELRAELDRVQK